MVCPHLQRTNAENSKQIFREKELRGHSPNFHIHVSENDLYIPWSAYSSAGKYVDRSWKYIIAHWHINVDIGTEATQLPEKEYINGIFVAVHVKICNKDQSS